MTPTAKEMYDRNYRASQYIAKKIRERNDKEVSRLFTYAGIIVVAYAMILIAFAY